MASILTNWCVRLTGEPRRSGDRGASLVEYALLLALIAIVCLAAVSFLGAATSSSFSSSGNSLTAS